MSIINIPVGRSRYNIDCLDSEREKILKLASKINERVNHLALNIRDIDEKTLLVICMLTIEDELNDALQLNSEESKDSDIGSIAEYIRALKIKIRDQL